MLQIDTPLLLSSSSTFSVLLYSSLSIAELMHLAVAVGDQLSHLTYLKPVWLSHMMSNTLTSAIQANSCAVEESQKKLTDRCVIHSTRYRYIPTYI